MQHDDRRRSSHRPCQRSRWCRLRLAERRGGDDRRAATRRHRQRVIPTASADAFRRPAPTGRRVCRPSNWSASESAGDIVHRRAERHRSPTASTTRRRQATHRTANMRVSSILADADDRRSPWRTTVPATSPTSSRRIAASSSTAERGHPASRLPPATERRRWATGMRAVSPQASSSPMAWPLFVDARTRRRRAPADVISSTMRSVDATRASSSTACCCGPECRRSAGQVMGDVARRRHHGGPRSRRSPARPRRASPLLAAADSEPPVRPGRDVPRLTAAPADGSTAAAPTDAETDVSSPCAWPRRPDAASSPCVSSWSTAGAHTWQVMDGGDTASQRFITDELRRLRPDDADPVGGGPRGPSPLHHRPGLDHRPARRDA